MTELSCILRSEIRSSGETYESLAAKIGVTKTAVGFWTTGFRVPRETAFWRLLDALNLTQDRRHEIIKLYKPPRPGRPLKDIPARRYRNYLNGGSLGQPFTTLEDALEAQEEGLEHTNIEVCVGGRWIPEYTVWIYKAEHSIGEEQR